MYGNHSKYKLKLILYFVKCYFQILNISSSAHYKSEVVYSSTADLETAADEVGKCSKLLCNKIKQN